jgi:ATP-binding cassette subfamily F protein 3
MLNISNISKSYGDQTLFTGVNADVGNRDRIALIGPNGSGKTTLFDIIAGKISPDSGYITRRKGATIGYLKQEISPSSKRQLLEDVINASPAISTMAHRIAVLQESLKKEPDAGNQDRLLRELGELQHSYEAAGGYNIEHEAKIILSGLGYSQSDFERPLSEFSGGWLMRAELAKLLLTKPDLLLLDEPTNHLDLEACIWFENYLESYRGAIIVTSHDRAFLNRVVSKILAIEQGEIISYHGNYNDYVVARQKDLQIKQAAARRQEREIQRETRFIERFRAKARKASQVQSRIKRLEKLERVVVPRATKKIHFSFPEPPRSGKEVIRLKNIQKSYDTNTVYRDLNLVLYRGDRVALVGPNGAGKTTLLKVLAEVLPFERGERETGHNVITSYYAQYVLELLNPENSILTELQQSALELSEQDIRRMLGAFLFSGDDVYKSISVLSGGEKARLALAKILIQPSNLLLMDEPTNHLDIPSREILSDALDAYKGTLCFITHDRTLIRQIANKIIEINHGQLTIYPDDYDSYLYRKEVAGESESIETSKADTDSQKLSRSKRRQRKQAEGELRNRLYQESADIRRQINEIEAKLSSLEPQLLELENIFSNQDYYKKGAQIVDSIEKHRRLKEEIRLLTEEWERLSQHAERIQKQYDEARNKMGT